MNATSSRTESRNMRRLIITWGDSEAGCLKMTRLADKVLPLLGDHLVNAAPLSDKEIEAFFGPSRHTSEPLWQAWITAKDGMRDETDHHLGFLDVAAAFDVIELWFAPDPRAQIQLANLLWYIARTGCDIDKLVLARVDFPIAEHNAAEVMALRPAREKLTRAQLQTGRLLWNAFVHPTPEALFDLLAEDLSPLPWSRRTVLRLLKELPSVKTGLGSTEMNLLWLAGRSGATWTSVAEGYHRFNHPPTIPWSEAELLLHRLASCAAPAVSGFVLAPFRDPPEPAARFDKDLFLSHRKTPLSLTPLGRDLVQDKADFTRHNPVDRWLGGTRLTTDRLWRWDAERCSLIGYQLYNSKNITGF